jgi:very-short-patch-repair endonuclease
MENHTCSECSQKFDSHSQKANHIRWKHRDNTQYFQRLKFISIKREEAKHGKWTIIECICQNCQSSFKRRIREGKENPRFCSQNCANKRCHSNLTKHRISLGVSKKWNDEEYAKKCLFNNRVIRKRWNSKGELEVREQFQSLFPEDGWTFGGRLKVGENIFVARDLYSHKLKVCIEYDGIWHFKDIHHQLELKQLKDAALEKWCIKNGWRLIRISEGVYNQNKKLWFDTLVDEVRNGTSEIRKFY